VSANLSEQSLAALLVGRSPAMRKLRERILRLADSSLPVLIEGPTGSGKELVAQALHAFSGRPGPFVPFNVCAIAETMFEDAVFGHVRGAFTGATDDAPGYLFEADRGTAFLDEISGLPLLMQAKLLRAVETREFRPVGAKRDRRSDFRLIVATNEDLARLVSAGRFRDDLRYRLRAGVIHVPALRERPEDIPELATCFARRASGCADGNQAQRSVELSTAAIRTLELYGWPGNVRELRNVIELALVLGDNALIGSTEIAEALWDVSGARQSAVVVEEGEFERRRLVDVLERCDWDTARAARELGMHRSHLYRVMQQLAIAPRRRAVRASEEGERKLGRGEGDSAMAAC
jgi:DNA-binding NtrC family response regulator